MSNNLYRVPKTDYKNPTTHTLLQRITCRVTWAINFRLHPFQISGIRELKLSDRTRSLALSHEQIREDLIESIKSDLAAHKADILAQRREDNEYF